MSDSISNFIIALKNASMAGKETARATNSKLLRAVAEVLEAEGYLAKQPKKGKKQGRFFEVAVAYDEEGEPRVRGVRRVSKPSRRVYLGSVDITPVKNNLGILVLSTPRGVMTGRQARKERVGGEALFEIW